VSRTEVLKCPHRATLPTLAERAQEPQLLASRRKAAGALWLGESATRLMTDLGQSDDAGLQRRRARTEELN
jgi:hypothetical protein